MGPLTKERFLLCNGHGTFVIDLHSGKLVYGQGPLEALRTGFAWADFDVALQKLQQARLFAPEEALALASVIFEYENAYNVRAVSTRIFATV